MRILQDKILLFIPMYNCAPQIPRVLAQLTPEVTRYLSAAIVVNNRSTDDGEAVVEAYLRERPLGIPVHLLRNDENYGLGGSHKVAFRYALTHGYDYLLVLHGDDQGSIRDILPYLADGSYRAYDAFLGARFMRGSTLPGYSAFRTFGNRVYNLLFSLGTGRRIYDLGSGLNLYRVAALREAFYARYADGLLFNYCLILGEAYQKQKIKFFPISWREEDQTSNVKLVSQALSVLKLLSAYIWDKKKFQVAEHREKAYAYTAKEIFVSGVRHA